MKSKAKQKEEGGGRIDSEENKVMTVHGPIDASDLGKTSIHEHLVLDLRTWYAGDEIPERWIANDPINIKMLGRLRRDPFINKDNLALNDAKAISEELSDFRKSGGRTVVDCTTAGLGRSPATLKKISTAAGVQVVAGCGYYTEESYPPWVKKASVDKVASEIVRDLTEGMDGTGVRAGLIGEIGLTPAMTEQDRKITRAAARAHKQAGAPILFHQWVPPSSSEGEVALDILEEEGVKFDRVTMSHSDEKDLDLSIEFLKRGAYLNFDHFGLEFYWEKYDQRFICDSERVEKVAELVKRGYASRMMLAHDVCLKMQLKRFGGFGYDHILRSCVKMLQNRGVTPAQIDEMLVKNPARFLPWPCV